MSSKNLLLDMERWHDYQVDSQKEITKIMRAACDGQNLVNVSVDDGETSMATVSILAVDEPNHEVIVALPASEDQLQQIMMTEKVCFETSLEKIRILFSVVEIGECDYNGQPALFFNTPESVIRLQRREWYRMEPPASDGVRCTLVKPADLGGGSCLLSVADISCGGLALLDEGKCLCNVVGRVYPNCRIMLPDASVITASLEIKNSSNLTLPNGREVRRIGCKFRSISLAMLDRVQRYIVQLELAQYGSRVR